MSVLKWGLMDNKCSVCVCVCLFKSYSTTGFPEESCFVGSFLHPLMENT